MISPAVVLAGATLGAGVALVVAGLQPYRPDLTAVVARLDAANVPTRPTTYGPSSTPSNPIARWATTRLAPFSDRFGLPRLRADLELVGDSPSHLLVRKVGYAALGLAFPPVLAFVMAVIGLRLPIAIPAIASVAFAAVLFFVPDLDVRRGALGVRREMRRAVVVYLELVALERAADAGASEALHRAAAIGDGRAFALIRDALTRAQLSGVPAWQGIEDLATSTGMPELGDVADIMRLSGEGGAAVYATLRTRAASLRTALINQDVARANSASEQMVMPVAMLGLVFMVLLAYPALIRILSD